MFTALGEQISSLMFSNKDEGFKSSNSRNVDEDIAPKRLRKIAIQQRIEEKKFTTTDGVSIKMRVIKGKRGSPLMLLASPLGFEDMSIFWPIIDKFQKRYTYVNWNYRGLFDSDAPRRHRQISIRDQAEDAVQVIQAAGFDHAEVMVGHSMGVQVSLETVLLYPERVNSLILINGGYGQVFTTAFQPIIRVPFVGNISEWMIRMILKYNPQRVLQYLVSVLTWGPIEKLLYNIGSLGGSQVLVDISGEGFINEWINMYFGGLAKDEKSARNYCRLFQELHCHNVYHLLETIEHPTLLISGYMDYLTPSYHMSEMAKLMPNSYHVCDPWSTHMTLMENPQLVIEETEKFLVGTSAAVDRYRRADSVRFEEVVAVEGDDDTNGEPEITKFE